LKLSDARRSGSIARGKTVLDLGSFPVLVLEHILKAKQCGKCCIKCIAIDNHIKKAAKSTKCEIERGIERQRKGERDREREREREQEEL